MPCAGGSLRAMDDFIRIRGARQHNLKNLDLDLPRRAFIVVTGPSGSGKSSLALDTLFAEITDHVEEGQNIGVMFYDTDDWYGDPI